MMNIKTAVVRDMTPCSLQIDANVSEESATSQTINNAVHCREGQMCNSQFQQNNSFRSHLSRLSYRSVVSWVNQFLVSYHSGSSVTKTRHQNCSRQGGGGTAPLHYTQNCTTPLHTELHHSTTHILPLQNKNCSAIQQIAPTFVEPKVSLARKQECQQPHILIQTCELDTLPPYLRYILISSSSVSVQRLATCWMVRGSNPG